MVISVEVPPSIETRMNGMSTSMLCLRNGQERPAPNNTLFSRYLISHGIAKHSDRLPREPMPMAGLEEDLDHCSLESRRIASTLLKPLQ